MSYFDIALIVIMSAFIINGFIKGFIRLLGSIVGLILGIFVASRFYLEFYKWAESIFGGREALGKVISFIVVFIALTLLINWAFVILEKIFKIISIIPFTKLFNRLLGAGLGFLEGVLFIGIILFVISKYAWIGSLFGNNLLESQLSPFFLKMVNIIMPILPEALKALQSIF